MTRYRHSLQFTHETPCRIGVLLVNLGTPKAPTAGAIRHYLRRFLSDPRVIEIPRFAWLPILYGFILPFRPQRLVKQYRAIWLDDGSPLKVHADALASRLRSRYSKHHLADSIRIETAMTYSEPSIEAAMKRLYQANCHKLLVLPLFPQYSATTTGAVFDAVTQFMQQERFIPELRFLQHYCDEPGYIQSNADSIAHYIAEKGKPDKFIFSFHGLPRRNLDNGDPYHCQCHKTARLIAKQAALADGEWQVTFQSRFGKAEWLKPYTDLTLTSLAKQGIKKIAVICPGFPIDCLETLEEIALLNKHVFLDAGGDSYDHIPALNDSDSHVEFLFHYINRHIEPWASPNLNCPKLLSARAEQMRLVESA